MPEAGAATILGISTEVIGVWIAAFLTLAIFSFLYRDNPLYKLAEHLFVGVSAGCGVVIAYQESVVPDLITPLLHPEQVGLESPSWLVLVPGALGMLMFSRFVPRYDWLSRWPIAFVMGLYSGLAIPPTIQAYFIEQMRGTMGPVLPSMKAAWPGLFGATGWAPEIARLAIVFGGMLAIAALAWVCCSDRYQRATRLACRIAMGTLIAALVGFLVMCLRFAPDTSAGAVWAAFSSLLLLVGALCTLAYFYFSRPHEGTLGVVSRVGIFFLMVAFGASFGNTVMARVSLLIGRVQFLYFDWWGPLVSEPIQSFLRYLGGG